MPTITLPHGDVHYRTAGPADGDATRRWSSSTASSSTARCGVASPTPWPRGASARSLPTSRSAPTASRSAPRADQSPRGVARQVIALIEALDLDDVTLVGNDTGGAICQYLLDTDASRIGRLVLTNCDAFEQFPPPALRSFIELVTPSGRLAAPPRRCARHGSATAASASARSPTISTRR